MSAVKSLYSQIRISQSSINSEFKKEDARAERLKKDLSKGHHQIWNGIVESHPNLNAANQIPFSNLKARPRLTPAQEALQRAMDRRKTGEIDLPRSFKKKFNIRDDTDLEKEALAELDVIGADSVHYSQVKELLVTPRSSNREIENRRESARSAWNSMQQQSGQKNASRNNSARGILHTARARRLLRHMLIVGLCISAWFEAGEGGRARREARELTRRGRLEHSRQSRGILTPRHHINNNNNGSMSARSSSFQQHSPPMAMQTPPRTSLPNLNHNSSPSLIVEDLGGIMPRCQPAPPSVPRLDMMSVANNNSSQNNGNGNGNGNLSTMRSSRSESSTVATTRKKSDANAVITSPLLERPEMQNVVQVIKSPRPPALFTRPISARSKSFMANDEKAMSLVTPRRGYIDRNEEFIRSEHPPPPPPAKSSWNSPSVKPFQSPLADYDEAAGSSIWLSSLQIQETGGDPWLAELREAEFGRKKGWKDRHRQRRDDSFVMAYRSGQIDNYEARRKAEQEAAAARARLLAEQQQQQRPLSRSSSLRVMTPTGSRPHAISPLSSSFRGSSNGSKLASPKASGLASPKSSTPQVMSPKSPHGFASKGRR